MRVAPSPVSGEPEPAPGTGDSFASQPADHLAVAPLHEAAAVETADGVVDRRSLDAEQAGQLILGDRHTTVGVAPSQQQRPEAVIEVAGQ
jgi:hypothetical protein